MNQKQNAERFHSLHVPGQPLVLYNAWDAGSARVIAEAGARAIATGSWSVAAAQGYDDGECIPLDLLERLLARIVAVTPLPVSADFESGYAAEPAALAENLARVLSTGIVGINFEDRAPADNTLYPVVEQAARISAIRKRADAEGVPLFINARTDLFLQAPAEHHGQLLSTAVARAAVYRDAGASGFFVPGLSDEMLIGELCNAVALPVNVMLGERTAPSPRLAALGVARVSYGPVPYLSLTGTLRREAQEAISG